MTVRAKGSMGKMEGVGGVIRKAQKVEPKNPEVPKKEAKVSATSTVKSNSN
jgi:hypothetical protein